MYILEHGGTRLYISLQKLNAVVPSQNADDYSLNLTVRSNDDITTSNDSKFNFDFAREIN